jgi:hypothetical protein
MHSFPFWLSNRLQVFAYFGDQCPRVNPPK